MGFAITKLVIRIIDPFASVDAIKAQVQEIKALEEKVINYPDLQPTDRATIYTKAKLNKAIWNTRLERDKRFWGSNHLMFTIDLTKLSHMRLVSN